jgi:hypothetical protein
MGSRRSEYKHHTIEVRTGEDRSAAARAPADSPGTAGEEERELLIDGEPVAVGRLVDGSYVLEDYAYDPRDDLEDLARRYIDHGERAGEAARAAEARRQGGDE